MTHIYIERERERERGGGAQGGSARAEGACVPLGDSSSPFGPHLSPTLHLWLQVLVTCHTSVNHFDKRVANGSQTLGGLRPPRHVKSGPGGLRREQSPAGSTWMKISLLIAFI